MLDSKQKITGRDYTGTVALLAIAFVVTPALLVMSRPFEFASLSIAVVCSALCAGWAWIHWKRSSELTIPTISAQAPDSK